ncbi:hypothetical protein [Winogradskyella sp.]|uniref:hypothetical protein n=1 Tax=Winogradskyella sp. TaxID=1883156 RepID=UPI0025D1B667|nr:hypothetical protein [Winogradskyella sp.]MBT8243892.1 hypothetical protein [Winogradskyella sp.]
MSFSNSTDDLYSASYYSNVEKVSEAELNETAWLASAARLAVRAIRHTRRAYYAAESVVVARTAYVYIILSHNEGHSSELYAKNIENLINQKLRSLG